MLRLEKVTKRFGAAGGVEGLSFSIDRPGVVGLLGANGAGKSTTLRIVAGVIEPGEGTVSVAGRQLGRDGPKARSAIGHLPERPALYGEMTGAACLEYAARLHGLDGEEARQAAARAATRCGVSTLLEKRIETLSRGQRQKVGLAQAIVHDPKVLLLDEPTAGFDPVQRMETRGLIRELGKDRLVLLSSHLLSEVGSLCRRVLFLRDGRLVADRDLSHGADKAAGATIALAISDAEPAMGRTIESVEGVHRVRWEDQRFLIETEPGKDVRRAIIALVHESGWTLLSYDTLDIGLQALFYEERGGVPC